jgi:hypothetical protein
MGMGIFYCKPCAMEEFNFEKYIYENFYKSKFIKYICLKKIKFSLKLDGTFINNRLYINEPLFINTIKFLNPGYNTMIKNQYSSENFKFVQKIISESYKFIDNSNKNNFDFLLLFIFPILSQNLKENIIIKEFFYLISNSHKDNNLEKYDLNDDHRRSDYQKKNYFHG